MPHLTLPVASVKVNSVALVFPRIGRQRRLPGLSLSPLCALLVGDGGLDPLIRSLNPVLDNFPGPFTAPFGDADLGDVTSGRSGEAPLPPEVTGVRGREPGGREGGDKAPTPSPAALLSLKNWRATWSRSWSMLSTSDMLVRVQENERERCVREVNAECGYE